jgi:hypothetical protein
MNICATVEITGFKTDEEINSVITSLMPDNVGIGDTIKIFMYGEKNKLVIKVECVGSLGSFIHTFEDLMRCLLVSIDTLRITK